MTFITEEDKERVLRDQCPDCRGKLINSRRGMEQSRICKKCGSVFIMVPKIDIKRG